MEVDFECTYCGHKWIYQIYSKDSIKYQVCPKCGDRTLKASEKDSTKVDYYQGCPAFPEKPIKRETKDENLYDYFFKTS